LRAAGQVEEARQHATEAREASERKGNLVALERLVDA
jgi:hypothetical protein